MQGLSSIPRGSRRFANWPPNTRNTDGLELTRRIATFPAFTGVDPVFLHIERLNYRARRQFSGTVLHLAWIDSCISSARSSRVTTFLSTVFVMY